VFVDFREREQEEGGAAARREQEEGDRQAWGSNEGRDFFTAKAAGPEPEGAGTVERRNKRREGDRQVWGSKEGRDFSQSGLGHLNLSLTATRLDPEV
jgi:hypothetical protein